MLFTRYPMEPGGPRDFHWPTGPEHFEQSYSCQIAILGRETPVSVLLGWRDAFGRQRRRIVVVVGDRAAAEFVGADDYEDTRHVLAVLKWPESNEHVAWDDWCESVFPSLLRFEGYIVRHKDRVSPHGFDAAALCVPEADGDIIVDFGLVRAYDKAWV